MYFGHNKKDNSDSREARWDKEVSERGFDSSELWSLGDTVVEASLFLIKEHGLSVSNDFKQGLELFIRDNGTRIFSNDEEKIVNASLNDFGVLFDFDEIREVLSKFISIRLAALLLIEADESLDSKEQQKIFSEQYEKPILVLNKILDKDSDLNKEELETLNQIGKFLPGWWF